jgi:predicted ATPase
LPFIDDIGVQNLTNDSLLPYVTETYTDQAELYAGLMSEGTIAAITLVVIFYFEERPLVILEDPDRGMHPKLMSRVVEMMKEVSKERQIIVTTHHPEMVRYAGVENLLLVSRDENGFSQITRPADKTMVKRFLENDIGIDELYVDDLLEV